MPRRLPKYVQRETTRHGRTVYYFRRNDGPRIRLPEIGSPDFDAAYNAAKTKGVMPKRSKVNAERRELIYRALGTVVSRAKERAKRKGYEYDLSVEWARQQVVASDYRCPVSGIVFCQDGLGVSYRAFWPSIDRIDPRRGYTMDNCRIVTVAMNIMLHEWGLDIFRVTADGVRKREAALTRPKSKAVPIVS